MIQTGKDEGMEGGIGGDERIWGSKVIATTSKVGNDTPGFFHQQDPGGDVPGLDAQFPVPIEAPGSHVRQIDGSRAQAAYPLGALGEVLEVVQVIT